MKGYLKMMISVSETQTFASIGMVGMMITMVRSYEIMSDHAITIENKPEWVNFQQNDLNTSVYTEFHAEFESGHRFVVFGPPGSIFQHCLQISIASN